MTADKIAAVLHLARSTVARLLNRNPELLQALPLSVRRRCTTMPWRAPDVAHRKEDEHEHAPRFGSGQACLI